MAEDKLTVKVYDDKKQLVDGEIVMTYGLLNLLVREVGDINRIGVLDIDPDVAMEVLRIVLIPRNARGKPTVDDTYEVPNMPVDQAELIFTWVKASVLDFFLSRLENTANLMTANQARLSGIGSFLSGSQASPSATASSGDLASSPVT